MPSWLAFVPLSLAWGPGLVLVHELGHGLAALALTDGEVKIRMRPGLALLMLGECTYDANRLRAPRAEAWIAAAGPAATLLCLLILAWAALQPAGGLVLDAGAASAAGLFFITALPMRYGRGLGEWGAESDGRAVWRILTGAPPGGVRREEARLGRPERAMHPAAAVALTVVAALTVVVDPSLLPWLAGLFGVAYLLQRVAG